MSVSVRYVDTVVVGSGVAGLTVALTTGHCHVISKTALGAGSSRWAQGGIAAAMGNDDEPELHADDTVDVSGGLGDAAIAAIVTGGAPGRIRWLLGLGAAFDRNDDGGLELGREAGHRRRRIVHANGDATGAELMRTLVRATRQRPDIVVHDNMMVVDLVRQDDRIAGVYAIDEHDQRVAILARAVVVATGGIGRLYRHTTNPREVTGDGLAMAIRSGATIRDPEFVQFHPTALATNHDPMPLLTEALRGEGAHLIDESGRRYMVDIYPDAELAPRDVVARNNWLQLHQGPIYLDARSIGTDFPERFPTVFNYARLAGIDPRQKPLPVSPAQHYHMGGVVTDSYGMTSVPGLYVCGEAASTGLHGANRLASNSLLEGLVIGARVAEAIERAAGAVIEPQRCVVPADAPHVQREDDEDSIQTLRDAMWEYVGVIRDDAGLRKGAAIIEDLTPRLATSATGRNLTGIAGVITRAALAREESRGGHWRSDHPGTATGPRHTVIRPQPVEHTALTPSYETVA